MQDSGHFHGHGQQQQHGSQSGSSSITSGGIITNNPNPAGVIEGTHSRSGTPDSFDASSGKAVMKRSFGEPGNINNIAAGAILSDVTKSAGADCRGDYDCLGKTTSSGAVEEKRVKTVKIYTQTEVEIFRLIGQYLRDKGLADSVEVLARESGSELEHVAAARFRQHVLSGQWDSAIEQDMQILAPFIVGDDAGMKQMKFLLLEQKYLELLEAGSVVEALRVLREDLSPLKYNTDRLHRLSSYLMYSNIQDLRQSANWDGAGRQSREKLMDRLQAFLPASVMLPPHRLETLLRQAVRHQQESCPFHNLAVEDSLIAPGGSIIDSLLNDHACGKELFPCETYQVLTEHCDEVWYCQFSHSGQFLATGSKESAVIIWELEPPLLSSGLPAPRRLRQKFALEGHTFGVAYLAWSPNDSLLAVVGPEDGSPDVWIWNTNTGELRHKMTHSPDDSFTCVAWHRDGQRYVCGGIKGQFFTCDLDGNILTTWEGVRIRALWCMKDGKTVLAADAHNRLRSYVFEDLLDKTLIKEDHPITTFTLDASERYALLMVAQQGVHMWDIVDCCLVRRYRGVSQGYYTIYSCFGGFNEDFVACGSEHNAVVVWHRNREQPLSVLRGHTGVVNCVAWNPRDPGMLVSCSDDGTVRVWGPAAVNGGSSGGSGTGTPEREQCEVSSTTSNASCVHEC